MNEGSTGALPSTKVFLVVIKQGGSTSADMVVGQPETERVMTEDDAFQPLIKTTLREIGMLDELHNVAQHDCCGNSHSMRINIRIEVRLV